MSNFAREVLYRIIQSSPVPKFSSAVRTKLSRSGLVPKFLHGGTVLNCPGKDSRVFSHSCTVSISKVFPSIILQYVMLSERYVSNFEQHYTEEYVSNNFT